MAKIFNRGELKRALLSVVGTLDEAHGYAIMQELQRRVGRDWRPSPGAIYPALLALEDEGLLRGEERDGLRLYSLTPAGDAALEAGASAAVWQAVGARVRAAKPRLTLGRVLDRFAVEAPERKRELTEEQATAATDVLAEAGRKIMTILKQGDHDG